MRIITLSEYYSDDPREDNYYKMMKLWLHHINMFASECEVEFLYLSEDRNWVLHKDFQDYIKRFNNLSINFKKIEVEKIGAVPGGRKLRHDCLFNHKLSILKNEEKPYVWMDIDVYLFHPLKEFYKHLDEHPLVGTGHGSYVRDQTEVFNSGLYAVKEDFLDLSAGVETCLENNKDNHHACHDQNVTHFAMKNAGYNPFVFSGHEKWNWWGIRCNFEKSADGNYRHCTNKEGEQIYASHFWGLQKPWRHGDSKPFWEESMRQIL